MPLLELLRNYRLACTLATGLQMISTNGFYLFSTFTLAYVTERFGLSTTVGLIGILLAGAAEFAGTLLFRLGGRSNRRECACHLWLWFAGLVGLSDVLARQYGQAGTDLAGDVSFDVRGCGVVGRHRRFDGGIVPDARSLLRGFLWVSDRSAARRCPGPPDRYGVGPLGARFDMARSDVQRRIIALMSFISVCLVARAQKVSVTSDVVRVEAAPSNQPILPY